MMEACTLQETGNSGDRAEKAGLIIRYAAAVRVAMKVVTTFHQPSSVLASLKCRLGSRDTENLVVAKINKLIVYSIPPHGLQRECSLDVWGKVLTVKAIPIPVRPLTCLEQFGVLQCVRCLEVAPIQPHANDCPPRSGAHLLHIHRHRRREWGTGR